MLTEGTDYESHAGSTVITIFTETLEGAGEGTHTIAAEFHEAEGSDGTPDGSLKRTAQNYTVDLKPVPTATPRPTATPNPTQTNNPSGGPVTTQNQTVAIQLSVVDENNEPKSGLQIELHSTPQTAVTNDAVRATFNSVEFGQHIMRLKQGNKLVDTLDYFFDEVDI